MSDKYQKAPKGQQQNDKYNRYENEIDPDNQGDSQDDDDGDMMSEQQSKQFNSRLAYQPALTHSLHCSNSNDP